MEVTFPIARNAASNPTDVPIYRGGGGLNPASIFGADVLAQLTDSLSAYATNSDGTGSPTIGGSIGYNADNSGNSNNATQPTSAKAPLLQQSLGRYYLQYNGSSQYMAMSVAVLSDRTLIMVCKEPDTSASVRGLLSPTAYGYLATVNGQFAYYPSGYATSTHLAIGGTSTTLSVIVATESANRADIYVNGTKYSASSPPASTVSRTYNAVGSYSSSSLFSKADQYYAAIINRACTDAEASSVYAWAKAQYGIA